MNAHPLAILRALLAAVCLTAVASAHAGSFTISLPNGAKTYTFAQCASFTWSGSTLTCVPTGTPQPPPPPPPPPAPSGSPFTGCPDGSLMIDVPYGTTALNTFDYGYFSTQILSMKVTVPLTVNTGLAVKTSSWVEYGDGGAVRQAVLSTRPCDFSDEFALRTATNRLAKSQDTISFSFKYTLGPPTTYAVHFDPGGTYYLNVRNRFSDGSISCPSLSCSMRGGFPP